MTWPFRAPAPRACSHRSPGSRCRYLFRGSRRRAVEHSRPNQLTTRASATAEAPGRAEVRTHDHNAEDAHRLVLRGLLRGAGVTDPGAHDHRGRPGDVCRVELG